MKRLFGNALLTLVALLLFLGAGELAGVFLESRNPTLRVEEQHDLGRRDPVLGFALKPGVTTATARINSSGFRGEELAPAKPPGTARIVFLGGSTTYGLNAGGDSLTFPALVKTLLGFRYGLTAEAVNAGVPAYTSWHTLRRLRGDILPLAPDAALIMDGLNDIMNAQMQAPDAKDREDAERQSMLLETTGFARQADRTLSRMALYRLLKSALSGIGARQAQESPLPPRERWQAGAARYEANTRASVAILRERGVLPILINYPWLPASGTVYDLSPERKAFVEFGRAELALANRRLARDLGVPLIDLQSAFDARSDDCGGLALYSDFIHFTNEGNLLAAEIIAEAVAGLIRPEAPAAASPAAPAGLVEAVRGLPVNSGLVKRVPGVELPRPAGTVNLKRSQSDGGWFHFSPENPAQPAFLTIDPPGGSWTGGCLIFFPRFNGEGGFVAVSAGGPDGARLLRVSRPSRYTGWSGAGDRYLLSIGPEHMNLPLTFTLGGADTQLWSDAAGPVFPARAILPVSP